MVARLRSLSAALLRRGRFEDSMRTEMQFHLEAYIEDLVKQGVPRSEAERRARMEFGTVDALEDDCRQSRGLRIFDEVRQDLRYAVRMMRKTPAVTLAAVISLALGIGANTAIFTLMDAVLLRTLPLRQPGELVFLAHGNGERPSTSSNYPLFDRYARLNVFDSVTAFTTATFKAPTVNGAENVDGMWVSGNFHATLGVPMALGCGFANEPDRHAGGARTAVISDRYWLRRFGGSRDVIGREIAVDGVLVTIVGVTAPEFVGMVPGQGLDITMPISLKTVSQADFLDTHEMWTSMPIVARLKPSVPEAQAVAAADVVFRQYMSEEENQWIARRDPEGFRSARLIPADKGTGALRVRYATPLAVLMAMVGLILLIASVNVANLLLVRGEARARELAIRLCIGCGRRRLIRQLLTESVLLAFFGAAVGFVLAMWGANAIMSLFGALETPILLDVSPNLRVLAFTTLVSLVSGLLFGLVPALKASHLDLTPALKEGGVLTTVGRQWRTGDLLLVTQLAVCVLVVTAAGLLVRSLSNLRSVDAGFSGEHVLMITVDSYGTTLDETQRSGLYTQALERLRALPGVHSVAGSRSTPIHTSGNSRALELPNVPETNEARGAWTNIVTPGYFDTFGIRLVRGRDFNPFDTGTSQKVAVINQTLARFLYGDADPLGKTFAFYRGADHPITVVGVTQDTYQMSLRDPVPRMIYTPLTQSEIPRWMTFDVRTAQNPAALAPAASEAIRSLSKEVVIQYVRTMDQQVSASLVRERLLATLSTAFGALALVLAAVGLYGVMSYNVSRRQREIGIRIALGAARGSVLWQVLHRTLALSSIGIAAGVATALLASRLLSTLLFGLTPTDAGTFAVVVMLLLSTAALAGLLPARRAATMDPVRAIKTE